MNKKEIISYDRFRVVVNLRKNSRLILVRVLYFQMKDEFHHICHFCDQKLPNLPIQALQRAV